MLQVQPANIKGINTIISNKPIGFPSKSGEVSPRISVPMLIRVNSTVIPRSIGYPFFFVIYSSFQICLKFDMDVVFSFGYKLNQERFQLSCLNH